MPEINRNSELPLYSQLSSWIRCELQAGKYLPGQQLPTDAELMKMFSVSYHTVRKAISELENDGIVSREQGRGTFVRVLISDTPNTPEQVRRIAAVFPWSGTSIFAPVVTAIEDVVHSHGYRMLLVNNRDDVTVEMEKMREVMDHNIDGLIWAIPAKGGNLAMMRKIVEEGTPVVLVDRQLPELAVDYVGTDNVAAMREVARHLAQCGCHRPAYIKEYIFLSATTERLNGFCEACETYGLKQPEIFCTRNESRENGIKCATQIFNRIEDFDSIVCQTDLTASGVISAAHKAEIRIPDDIQLIGFDDESFAPLLYPCLTTVHQDFENIGKTAANLLLDRINGNSLSAPIEKRISATVVVRSSTSVKSIVNAVS